MNKETLEPQWLPIDSAPHKKLIIGFAITSRKPDNWHMAIISKNDNCNSAFARERWSGWYCSIEPTHFMYLPHPPKGDEHE
jgi:hypothetical protein